MTSSNKQFVVIGQRRSGTSLFSAIVHKLGVPMGDEDILHHTSDKNPKGFYEDTDFSNLSGKIVRELQENPQHTIARLEWQYGEQIRELVEQKDTKPVWGFKDANQVHTHLLFKKHLSDPRYLFVFRNPLDIAKSVNEWHGEGDNNQFMGILDSVISQEQLQWELMKSTEEHQLICSYEHALLEPEKTVRSVADFIGVDDEEKIKKAKEHIDVNCSSIRNKTRDN